MAFPTPIAEAALGTGASESDYLVLDDLIRGKLDTGKLAPSDLWTDISAYVESFSVQRGARRHDGVWSRADAARLVLVLDNQDGRFDSLNLTGPYVSAGVSQIKPMRAIRLRCTYGATTYDLFRGFVDEWAIDYDGRVAVCTMRATDGTKVLSQFDGAEQAGQGAGEDTGARIGRILDNVGWPASDRDLDTGKTTVQATTLAANAWTEILLNSDTELGEVYFDGTGKLVFRNRHAVLTDSRSSVSQATFGDSGSELNYESAKRNDDDDQVVNLARIGRAGGTVQTAQDATSQTTYQKRVLERSDLLMQADAEAMNYARYVVALQKDAEVRFDELEVVPTVDADNLFPAVLARELGDRITIKKTTPDGRTVTRGAFIRGIEHSMSGVTWTTKFALQSAEKFAFLILDHAALGKLDSNALGY